MSKTLEGMARAICLAVWGHDYTPHDPLHPDARWMQAMEAARAGACFLADNVTQEMLNTFYTVRVESRSVMDGISAALRVSVGAET